MKKAELIFVPCPGVGHLVSTIEFAKRLIQLDHQLHITVLVIKLPITSHVDAYLKNLTDSQPRIRMVEIPQVPPPPLELFKKSMENYIYEVIYNHRSHVRNIVEEIMLSGSSSSESAQVVGIIVDLFCVCMIDICDELGVPSFIFFTSSAGLLNLTLYLPSRHEQIGTEFSDSDPQLLSIPGFLNPVPPTVLPGGLFNKNGGYDAFIQVAKRLEDAKGIVVNTFAELEPCAIELCNKGKKPKIYPVGPMVNLKSHPHPEMDKAEWDKIMKWLDDQPESSVVFLCFGSAGGFDAGQVKQIAVGLEQSGHNFVWSMRVPFMNQTQDSELKNPVEMLPEGFLERVQGRGVVCGWAPQAEVLAHKAIGGFVSHCGWNSILESLFFGVPIATLPMYAEQQLNAFTMVKELGLAMELKLDYRINGDIEVAEVVKAVRCLMDSDSEVRKKVKHTGEVARMATMENGSSFTSISEFIMDIRSNGFSY